MYPFFVLDVPHDTTDDAVEKRYYELVSRFSPETHPEVFRAVSEAYQALRTERGRFEAALFYGGASGLDDLSAVPCAASLGQRRRLSLRELADALAEDPESD